MRFRSRGSRAIGLSTVTRSPGDTLEPSSVPFSLFTVTRPAVMSSSACLREATGPGRVLGNHVVLDLGHGVYAVLAHLRRGSVRVAMGQRVAASEQLAECGNSGNSTEPHLHFQVCDRPSTLSCAAIPPTFKDLTILNADGPRPIQSGDIIKPN